jgi:hypothetical protein
MISYYAYAKHAPNRIFAEKNIESKAQTTKKLNFFPISK